MEIATIYGLGTWKVTPEEESVKAGAYGFAQLLEYQKENKLISGNAYQNLKEDTDYLTEKYQ